jgi:hypothetical protein
MAVTLDGGIGDREALKCVERGCQAVATKDEFHDVAHGSSALAGVKPEGMPLGRASAD